MNTTTNNLLEIEALLSACRIVSRDQSPAESIDDLLKILVSVVGLDKVRVLLPNKDGIYKVKYHYGLTEQEASRAEYHYGEGITGRVAKEKEIVLVPDIRNEPRFLGKITDLSIFNPTRVSYIALPILLKNHQTGVLAVNRLDAETPVLENDIILLQLFSAFIKQALDIHELIEQRTQRLLNENTRLKEYLTVHVDNKPVIGQSHALLDTVEKAKQSANTDASVFIFGESGTGKERIAKYIHNNSQRNDKVFIALNCAAIPDNLMESELFGHEKGAFTGAEKTKIGKFEAADGGTLFLDEIGDMNADVQSKLLRVLQESEITRVGSNSSIPVNVRIIAATHQNIQTAVKEGKFRLDLYYRLNVITLKLPALRERRGDVPLLIEYFLVEANRRYQKSCYFSEESMAMLTAYNWPGNIRQLENLVERCVILSTAEEIDKVLVSTGLTDEFGVEKPRETYNHEYDSRPYQRVKELDREDIIRSLVQSRGNKTQAARRMGMSARQLQYRIKKLDIVPEDII